MNLQEIMIPKNRSERETILLLSVYLFMIDNQSEEAAEAFLIAYHLNNAECLSIAKKVFGHDVINDSHFIKPKNRNYPLLDE